MSVSEITRAEERSQVFHDFITNTLTVLDWPEVTEALGQERIEAVTRLVRDAVLPTVTEGVANLLPEHQDTDNAVLLPVFPEEMQRGIQKGATLLMPTSLRFTRMRDSQVAAGLEPMEADERSLHGIQNFIMTPRPGNKMRPLLGPTTSAHGFKGTAEEPGYISRPVICVPADVLSRKPILQAAALTHEARHHFDYEDLTSTDGLNTLFVARSELGGYHDAARVLDACGMLGDFGNGVISSVEKLRQKHADPAAPLEPTPEIMDGLRRLGVLA